MNTFVKTLLTSTLLLAPLSSQAISISLNPVSQTVTVGSSFDVTLTISGLGDGIAPSLSAFDTDISFDQTILSFSSVTFGSFLGDPDPASFETITSFDDFTTPGIVNLFEVSLLDGNAATCIFCIPPYLDDLQPGEFTLATLTFNALAAGSSSLGINLNALADADANSLTADLNAARVNVDGTNGTVPEPPTLLLLVLGGLLTSLYFANRQKSRHISLV